MSLKTTLIFMMLSYCFNNAAFAQQNSLLWEISGNGLKKSSYLFGTIHFYDTAVFHLPDTLFRLIDKSSAIALELDLGKVTPGFQFNLFMEDTSGSLKDFLSDSAYAKLQLLTEETS